MTKIRHLAAPLLLVVVSGACGFTTLGADDEASPASPPVLTSIEAAGLAAFVESLGDPDVPDFDMEMALTLVAMPLSCLDRPHAAPRDRSTYLDEFVGARRPDYQRTRAFYGCWDWHSAVNSTWAMVRIYKEFPDLPIGGLVDEKLRDHLSAQALQGELEFFQANRGFERPYGWAWLMKLYAELRSWDHPDARRWADNVQPMVDVLVERTVRGLENPGRPSRSGAHSNSAYALSMMLDYSRAAENDVLEAAILAAAREQYEQDVGCPTRYEPWAADFLSPCLEEAALMAQVLAPQEFVDWFDGFMAPVISPDFAPLTSPVDASADDPVEDRGPVELVIERDLAEEVEVEAAEAPEVEEAATDSEAPADSEAAASELSDEQRRADEALRSLASRSHLIGLAFSRASAMNRIADALPPGDPRITAYRGLAARHGAMGFDAMFDASYAGSHWIGTFALSFLLSERGE